MKGWKKRQLKNKTLISANEIIGLKCEFQLVKTHWGITVIMDNACGCAAICWLESQLTFQLDHWTCDTSHVEDFYFFIFSQSSRYPTETEIFCLNKLLLWTHFWGVLKNAQERGSGSVLFWKSTNTSFFEVIMHHELHTLRESWTTQADWSNHVTCWGKPFVKRGGRQLSDFFILSYYFDN